jgi:hypothetical protein
MKTSFLSAFSCASQTPKPQTTRALYCNSVIPKADLLNAEAKRGASVGGAGWIQHMDVNTCMRMNGAHADKIIRC